MKKPRLLDLFCGAGGATFGYQLAGFHVVGVDHKPQPRYVGDGGTDVPRGKRLGHSMSSGSWLSKASWSLRADSRDVPGVRVARG